MAVAWFMARGERRHRLASLVGLALLVALVTAVVLAGVAGARRTTSALDRFRDETQARDIAAFLESPDLTDDVGLTETLRDEVAAVNGVTAVARGFGYFVDDGREDVDLVLVSSPDGYYDTIDRPITVAGRLPDRDAVDELALNQSAAEALDLGVGDRLRVTAYSPETIIGLFNGEGIPDDPDGPVLEFDVVGVVRTGEELSASSEVANAAGITSPAFSRAVEGEAGRSVLLLSARTEPGTDITAVQQVLTAQVGEQGDALAVPVEDDYVGEVSRSHRTLAAGVLVFSLVAALAGMVAVGQAITRQNRLRAPDDAVTRGLGATRVARTIAVGLPTTIATAAGVLVGIGVAVALSPLFPVSIARRAEVDPGVRVDLAVLVLGGALIVAAGTAWAWLSARSVVRRTGSTATARSPRAAPAMARWGASLPMTVGLRSVLERGGGPAPVSSRSAVLGAAIAVAGVIAVSVFVVTTDDARGDPARYGWAWSSSPDVLSQDTADAAGSLAPISLAATSLATDPEVAATAVLLGGTMEIGDETLYGYALDVQKGSMGFTVLDGELPTGPNEVALGRRSMEDLDVALGDRVEAATPGGAAELTVVGVIVPPLIDTRDPGKGAAFSVTGLDRILPESSNNYLVLTYADGADPETLPARLAADHDLDFIFDQGGPPGQLAQLADMRAVMTALVVFLAAIGVIGLLHFLSLSVHRRRGQFAVLRSIGFVRSQVRNSVSWQAVVATAFGVAIGIPFGVVLGRAAWLLAVRDIGMDDTPSTPWAAVVLVTLTALTGAALLALAPGRYASRGAPAETLRAE